jgi:hypothetical protein
VPGVRPGSPAQRGERDRLWVYGLFALAIGTSVLLGFVLAEAIGHGPAGPAPSPSTILDHTYAVPASVRFPSENSDFELNELPNATSTDWFNISFSAPVDIGACGAAVATYSYQEPYQSCAAAPGDQVLGGVARGEIRFVETGSPPSLDLFATEAITGSPFAISYTVACSYSWAPGLDCSYSATFNVSVGEIVPIVQWVNTTLPTGYSSVSITVASTVPVAPAGIFQLGGYLACCWHNSTDNRTWWWNGTYSGSAAVSLPVDTASLTPSQLRVEITVRA